MKQNNYSSLTHKQDLNEPSMREFQVIREGEVEQSD